MTFRIKKRLLIILLCLGIAILLYISCDFSRFQIALSLKINWNMNIPRNEVIYTCYTNKVNYYVCKIPTQQQQILYNQLIEQEPDTSSIKEVISDLEEINIDDDKYPFFETINYSIKKANHLSHLYLLYSSDSSILYIIEYLD